MPSNYFNRNFQNRAGTKFSGQVSPVPSQQTGTRPDQFDVVVQRARQVQSKVISGLLPKAATNTAQNTNTDRLAKTIGDLADLVETTFDPRWKETYRVALVRCLNAVEKSNSGARSVPAFTDDINARGGSPDTFSHEAVGVVPGLDVSAWSAIQCGYQQRFNPPAPAPALPALPVDPVAAGSEYNWNDVPGLGTTAIPTQTNKTGSFFRPRGAKPLGTSHR